MLSSMSYHVLNKILYGRYICTWLPDVECHSMSIILVYIRRPLYEPILAEVEGYLTLFTLQIFWWR